LTGISPALCELASILESGGLSCLALEIAALETPHDEEDSVPSNLHFRLLFQIFLEGGAIEVDTGLRRPSTLNVGWGPGVWSRVRTVRFDVLYACHVGECVGTAVYCIAEGAILDLNKNLSMQTWAKDSQVSVRPAATRAKFSDSIRVRPCHPAVTKEDNLRKGGACIPFHELGSC